MSSRWLDFSEAWEESDPFQESIFRFGLTRKILRNGKFLEESTPKGKQNIIPQSQAQACSGIYSVNKISLNICCMPAPMLGWRTVGSKIKNSSCPGLPWWHSGWESACQCRGHGFEPWSGKIPHAAEQLGPWATTAEPARLEPVPRNGRGRNRERPAHRDEEWPPLAATRESPHTKRRPNTAINK